MPRVLGFCFWHLTFGYQFLSQFSISEKHATTKYNCLKQQSFHSLQFCGLGIWAGLAAIAHLGTMWSQWRWLCWGRRIHDYVLTCLEASCCFWSIDGAQRISDGLPHLWDLGSPQALSSFSGYRWTSLLDCKASQRPGSEDAKLIKVSHIPKGRGR